MSKKLNLKAALAIGSVSVMAAACVPYDDEYTVDQTAVTQLANECATAGDGDAATCQETARAMRAMESGGYATREDCEAAFPAKEGEPSMCEPAQTTHTATQTTSNSWLPYFIMWHMMSSNSGGAVNNYYTNGASAYRYAPATGYDYRASFDRRPDVATKAQSYTTAGQKMASRPGSAALLTPRTAPAATPSAKPAPKAAPASTYKPSSTPRPTYTPRPSFGGGFR